MIRITQLKLPLSYTDRDLKRICSKELRINESAIRSCSLFRLSVDARHKNDVHYTASADVTLYISEKSVLSKAKSKKASPAEPYRYQPIRAKDKEKRPLIVGMGPSGLFCALTLVESGIRPIVIERGEAVDQRKDSVELFFGGGRLNTESNVQFGEGGAGAFSDGKLNTGTKDIRRRKVLEELVRFGAPEQILYDAKPHVGTDRLRPTVRNLREALKEGGADILFNTKLTDIITKNGKVVSAEIERNGRKQQIECSELVLCIGHSARDTFEMLERKGVRMEPKPFSVGVRIEHLREKIDFSQYGEAYRLLPPASYKESVHLKDGRGVYTFCMCPGGMVVASSSEENTVVTNGMSEFSRDRINSNAALLVSVGPDDIRSDETLKGIAFQRELERKAFSFGGEDYSAPVQRAEDFLCHRKSVSFGEVLPSYRPGTRFSRMDDILPPFVTDSLREALPMIDRRLTGFSHPDAVLTAVESRSSSPVRIVRDDSMQSVSLSGLYPCGEGAGYAGGIVSAAVDGIKAAERILDA